MTRPSTQVGAAARLADLTRDLYALDLDRIVPARDEQARALRAAGEKDLARELARLPKPTLAAWVVDLLARERPAQLEDLLGLGDGLRAATDQGDAAGLRRLVEQQRRSLALLVRQARELASERAVPVSESTATQLEDILRAAVADPGTADTVRAATLARRPPTAAGLPWPGVPPVRAQPAEEEAARAAEAAAAELLVAAQQRRTDARARARDAQAEADRLRAALATAEHVASAADDELASAEQAVSAAEEAVAAARGLRGRGPAADRA